jgi:hypothetical protein
MTNGFSKLTAMKILIVWLVAALSASSAAIEYDFTIEKLWDFSGTYFDDKGGGTTIRLQMNHSPQGPITGQRSETVTNETLRMAACR